MPSYRCCSYTSIPCLPPETNLRQQLLQVKGTPGRPLQAVAKFHITQGSTCVMPAWLLQLLCDGCRLRQGCHVSQH